jgi:hypothetical protein
VTLKDILLFIFSTSVLMLVVWPWRQCRNEKGEKAEHAANANEATYTANPIGASKPTNKEERNPNEKCHRRIERVYWFFSAIGSIVAAGAAGYAAYLAFGALHASQQSAGAAMRQVEIAKETEHKQLRAYVSAKVSPKGLTNFAPNQDAELEIGFQNSGQSPALDLVTKGILFLKKYPLPAEDDLTIPGTPIGTIPGAGITLHPRDIEFATTLKWKIDPSIYEAIKSTNAAGFDIARFYAFGTILYLDIFGIQHWTHFCYDFHGEGPTLTKWEACPRYNDTDKNE